MWFFYLHNNKSLKLGPQDSLSLEGSLHRARRANL
jgi:hypothetical protein